MGGSESVRFSGMMDDNIDKRLVRGGRRTGLKKQLNRGGKVDVNRNDGISNGGGQHQWRMGAQLVVAAPLHHLRIINVSQDVDRFVRPIQSIILASYYYDRVTDFYIDDVGRSLFKRSRFVRSDRNDWVAWLPSPINRCDFLHKRTNVTMSVFSKIAKNWNYSTRWLSLELSMIVRDG